MSSTNSSETTAPAIVGSMSFLVVIAFVFAALRFGCKVRYGRSFGLDDYILGLAWVCVAYLSLPAIALLISSLKR